MTQGTAVQTVLVIEDNADVLSLIQRMLTASGFRVVSASDGETGLAEALDREPDLVILDVGLPRRSGFEVAREMRQRGSRAPVLMLTARDTVTDKVAGLDAGADDYLAKPFDTDELIARVKALLRRSSIRAGASVLQVGDLSLDPITREVSRGGHEISLTAREYALLEYLMKHAGRELPREQIMEHVWGSSADPSTNVVDVYVNYLRKKLDVDGSAPLLHTVRGVGYVLRA
ncbi:MAG TPA: response regulator transcription factor [Gemmatimonadaceae bacterium]|nr:response regulator transcription factor [Gemmatimonadaceae bacterium]